MTMHAVFKFELEEDEILKIKHFCDSADYCAIEQSIGWTHLFYKSRICYYYNYDESGIRSFCQITEHLRSAHINFGPVCCDKDVMVTSIKDIIQYYRERKFLYLGVQMYYKSGYDTEYIDYSLNKLHSIKYIYNSENTKSSLEINLRDNSFENIKNKMRKGHRSDINRAIKLGITVDAANNKDDLNAFIDVYAKMCRVRNISDGELSKQNINEVYNYLIENDKGQILIVKDISGEVVGGAIFVYQGISVRYLKGASDPERREIPILHLVVFEAIKRAKINNFRYFDMWGYNHFADSNDQIFYINHFKKGFGGDFTFFAKKMNINLLPCGYKIYISLLILRKIYLRIFNRLK